MHTNMKDFLFGIDASKNFFFAFDFDIAIIAEKNWEKKVSNVKFEKLNKIFDQQRNPQFACDQFPLINPTNYSSKTNS